MDDRYSRQERFQPIGPAGQQAIRGKHVLIVGAGALGTINAEALVRAGIGTLSIVDRDYVEFSNLQRQQLYAEEDAVRRLPKAVAARDRLARINSDVAILAHVADVSTDNIEALTDQVDLILDATDNFETRLLINDIAQKRRIPWIYGACVGSYGSTYAILPGESPCLGCLLPILPVGGATCDTAGIIGPAAQMVAAYQSAQALKLLSGHADSLNRKWIAFDLWHNQHTEMDLAGVRKSDCASCGEHAEYPYLQASAHARTAVLCGRDTVQIRPAEPVRRNLEALSEILARHGGQVECNPYLVSLTVGEHRMVVFQDGRILVHGTKDIREARSLVHRYLG